MHHFVASKSGSPEYFERLHDETAAKKKKEHDAVLDEMKQGLIDALTKKCLALSVAINEVRVFAEHVGILTALWQPSRPPLSPPALKLSDALSGVWLADTAGHSFRPTVS